MRKQDKKNIKYKEDNDSKIKGKNINDKEETISSYLKFAKVETLKTKKIEGVQSEVSKSINPKMTLVGKKTLDLKSKFYDSKNDSRSLSKKKEKIYSNFLFENKSISPNKIISIYNSKSKGSLNNLDDFPYKVGNNQKLKIISPINKERRRNEKNIEFPIYTSRKENIKNLNINNNSINKFGHHLETDDLSEDRESRTLKSRLKESQSKKLTLPNQNTTENFLLINNNKNLSTEYMDYNNHIVDENQEYMDEYSLSVNNINKLFKKTINSPKEKPLITTESINHKNPFTKRPFSLVIKKENKKESSVKVLKNLNKIPVIEIEKMTNNRPLSQFPSILLLKIDKNKIVSFRDKKERNISAKMSKKNSAENINIKSNFSSKNFNKSDILSKISKFDERKITKLAKLIEKFEHTEIEEDVRQVNRPKKSLVGSLKNTKQTGNSTKEKIQSNNKYNINYIQTEAINFGNINISLNNCNMEKHINSSNINKELINNIKSILLNGNKSEEDKDNLGINNSDKKLKPFDLYSNFREKADLSHISNYSVISFLIISNWGNSEKVGLTEIQIFDKKGKKINIIECHVFNGSEEGINKTINNKFHITEENEMWVSKFNKDLKIEIYFEAVYEVHMIIVWNYNGKDLTKGVKEVQVLKKNNFVWKGIINKGVYNVRTNYSTTIYLNNLNQDKYNFEISDFKLEKLNLRKSNTNNYYLNINQGNLELNNRLSKENTFEKRNECITNEVEENKISNINPLQSSNESIKKELELKDLILNNNEIKNRRNQRNEASKNNSLNYMTSDEFLRKSKSSVPSILCKSITIIITSNWGDPNNVGLTQIQFLDQNFKKISENEILSYFTFPSNNNLDGNEFENLFDGNYETNDDLYMWQTEFSPGMIPYIEIEFNKPQNINGIKFWNFNKKDELDKGVKSIEIRFDENHFNKDKFPFLLRRALGKSNYDYSQTIYFVSANNFYSDEDLNILLNYRPASLALKQDYETPFLPTGFIFKLICLSNYGDISNIGLDGIELFDHLGNNALKNNTVKILLYPEDYEIGNKSSNNPLKSNSKSSINNLLVSKNGKVSFLSPYYDHKNIDINQGHYNTLYFVFDKPISISYVRFYNYSEKITAGVNEYIIEFDEELIYKGCIRRYEETKDLTCVFFTSDKNIISGLEDKIYSQFSNKNEYLNLENEKENIYKLSLFENNK